MKKLIALIVILIIVAAVVAGFAMRDKEEVGLAVQAAPAERGELRVSVTAPGTIRAEHRVSISARTSARIIELPFGEGELVDVDDVLVRLDDADAKAQVRSAEAGVRQARANLAVAEARIAAAEAGRQVNEASLTEANLELERLQSLLETSDVSQRAVESAKAAVERLRAQVKQDGLQLDADRANLAVLTAGVDAAEAGTERAAQNFQDTVIRSPIAGTVTRLNAEVGEVVVVGTMNNAGTVILEVADLTSMLCVAEIDEANVNKVAVGQPAIVRASAYGEVELPGTVRNVALAKAQPTVGMGQQASGGGHYEVEILLDLDAEAAAELRRFSGLTADVEIETKKLDDALLLPSQSFVAMRKDELPEDVRKSDLVPREKAFATVVWRVVDGVAKVTPVETGDRNLTDTQVTAGLEPGDVVVTGPFSSLEKITDGAALEAEVAGDDDSEAEAS